MTVICSINEKPPLDENGVEEILISRQSVNHHERKDFKTILPQVS